MSASYISHRLFAAAAAGSLRDRSYSVGLPAPRPARQAGKTQAKVIEVQCDLVGFGSERDKLAHVLPAMASQQAVAVSAQGPS